MINAIVGGAPMNKTPEAAYALMVALAFNNVQSTSFEKTKPITTAKVIEVNQVSNLNGQLTTLNKRFDDFERINVSTTQTTKICENCLGEYTIAKCTCGGVQTTKHVAYMRNFN